MRDKTAVLQRLLQLCDELEILPGGAARWVHEDLVEAAQIDSMALVQLSAVVEEEFGVLLTREDLAFDVKNLDQLAARIAST